MIEKSWRNQPQGSKSADDVIRIVLGIIDMGMVLQVHPGKNGKAEAKQQGSAMAHHRIPEAVRMGRVVAGVVNHRAL